MACLEGLRESSSLANCCPRPSRIVRRCCSRRFVDRNGIVVDRKGDVTRHGSRRLANERRPLSDALVVYHGRRTIGGSGYGIGVVVALESSLLLFWNRRRCRRKETRCLSRSRRLANERQPFYDTLVVYHGRQRIGGSGEAKGDDVNGRR